MALKAIIPPGQVELIVNGLHQWDYGQKLEIHSNDLPALIEVHFACAGMDSAVVRASAVVNGVATVAIPDPCLEQTTPITAWIYEIDDTKGTTTKTITMPIIQRVRPQQCESVPESFTDKYTELITAVNEQVGALRDGNVTVSHATTAGHADTAENAKFATSTSLASTAQTAMSAKTAEEARRADEATSAKTAEEAQRADKANWADLISNNWVKLNGGSSITVPTDTYTTDMELDMPGLYVFCIKDAFYNSSCTVLLAKLYDVGAYSTTARLFVTVQGNPVAANVYIRHSADSLAIYAYDADTGVRLPDFDAFVSYQRIT